MAEAVSVKLDGTRELVRSLRQVHKDLPKELTKIHKRIAEPVADRARRNATRGPTGRLKKSIKAYGTQRSASVGAGARIKYAGVQNYGWPAHHITGQHFLENALHDSYQSMLVDYEKELDRFIDTVWVSIV